MQGLEEIDIRHGLVSSIPPSRRLVCPKDIAAIGQIPTNPSAEFLEVFCPRNGRKSSKRTS
jgi:hypothetical protein